MVREIYSIQMHTQERGKVSNQLSKLLPPVSRERRRTKYMRTSKRKKIIQVRQKSVKFKIKSKEN